MLVTGPASEKSAREWDRTRSSNGWVKEQSLSRLLSLARAAALARDVAPPGSMIVDSWPDPELTGRTVIILVFVIAYEAVQRLAHPEPVQGDRDCLRFVLGCSQRLRGVQHARPRS